MIVSKAVGTWGEGANDATLTLEVLGLTPQESDHLKTLSEEPADLTATFENGALQVSLSFKRTVSLEDQAAKKAADEANAAAKAKEEAEKAEKEASAKAEEQDEELRKSIVERSAQLVADRLAPKG